jgi:hypothetical protein
MSCEACQKFQESTATSFFRWKNANVEVRACDEHLKEVFDVLRRNIEHKAVNNERALIDESLQTVLNYISINWCRTFQCELREELTKLKSPMAAI